MQKNLLRIMVALSSVIFTSAALAADDPRWYEIEVIIFSNINRDALNSENWPVDPGSPMRQPMEEILNPSDPALNNVASVDELVSTITVDNTKKPLKPAATKPTKATIKPEANKQFLQLKEEELGLSDEALKIATSQDYHLLLHTGWRQPVEKNDEPKYVYLDQTVSSYQQIPDAENVAATQASTEDKLLNALINADNTQTQKQSTVNVESPSVKPIPEGPVQNLVYGVVSLKMSRFLHFAVDMVYRAPYQIERSRESTSAQMDQQLRTFPMMGKEPVKTEQDALAQKTAAVKNNPLDIVGFRLAETRRVKTNELIFYDHPLFGILARIKPYDPPIDER